ncbi:MAG: efflux RND transporter periplasmic adaptor subunit [Alysiella sp.]|uniref:efflux RND transporter periplasmic adaptor subunit n=1 Tax=Alysiella sp. TaxID=1872483 RepID=UPI0026DC1B77|nr:efflux RND transporter periplasmic adaptor subunit [Alysiella sp.]MDO4434632.1 efflux RND transporter periplasmic adaptor subunit [Alysiella sp.]
MTSFNSTWRMGALALATALALSACGKDDKVAAQAQAAQQAPVPEVRVVTVQPQTVVLENNLPARLESVRSATIVPQVSGIVKRRLFEEGTFVRAGQALYQLEDASYAANLASARASLLTAQASLSKANADLARYQPLLAADAISKQEYDAALLAKRSAEAQVQLAQAAIRAAQVNVNHARIVAPISGVIGESKISEGALVAAGQTPMALIQQNDTMYVNITQSASEIMKLRRQFANNERKVNQNIEVGIVLEDGSEYEHKGRLLFVNPVVDANTGQITLRVAVPNPDLVLMSGLYVRVKLPFSSIDNAFLVPQQAVTRGQNDVVLVVTPDGEMQPRPVTIAGQQGNNWVITKGLQAGDKVIVNGTMIAGIMGAKKVTPKEWLPESINTKPVQAASSVAVVQAASESQAASVAQ